MQYRDPRAAEARRLRVEEGLSSKEIQKRLGVEKNRLQYWLAGLPTSQGLRSQARDDLKEKARQLRREGKTYGEIVDVLGVSQSSVSLWVRDIPIAQPKIHRSWTDAARTKRADTYAAKRAAKQREHLEAQRQLGATMGPFGERDILINGAIAYWCEGAKVKPWRPNDARVVFTNMDVALLKLFLRFLEVVPVEYGEVTFYVHIHEEADDGRAKDYWCRELGIDREVFSPTLWKRHNPKTVRKNVNTNYYGCLVVKVRKSRHLYWYIENLAKAALGSMGMPLP